ncbi:hypothetical protein CC1G_08611 [Coprinopsis cinerea okayama7|uniref:EthD domain-containing protein n=1 Tax=Coprinopsis cinerea (strain Okayama-7 / 130 / ATCC MYA-4618 / FGSC 9003) TaxID=240176 RepID=A8NCY7_COPC7|nr:hypothetical protein CC1G_08611 [Coprinopsis cinerea okayama7\|eukprot:XP_001832661.1 hypothetical protein CC1G_08611 [Coprinopsis cinerea okayama7\
MTKPEAQGLLYVLGEPGASVSEEEFNVWYDKDHAPLRLKVPGFQTAARYRSSDGHQPTWLAIYDLDTPEIAYSDACKALSTNAPQYELPLPAHRKSRQRLHSPSRNTCCTRSSRGRNKDSEGSVGRCYNGGFQAV